MDTDNLVYSKTLGEDLRSLRASRNLTLEQLAHGLGRSVGWLSQVEREKSKPTIDDLRKFAAILDVPLSLFFGTPDVPTKERGRIVRSQYRRTIGEDETGLHEELLSPDLTDDFEMIRSTFQPGSKSDGAITRQTQEVAFLVSGKLDLWIGEDEYTIHAGDSFRIRGESYRWQNPYSKPAVAIWVISPPVY